MPKKPEKGQINAGNSLSIAFQVRTIEILDAVLNAPDQLPGNVVFQFDIQLQHRFNLEKKLILVLCSVTIRGESNEIHYGKFRASCIYEVPDLQKLYNEQTRKLDLPESLVIALNSVSISTTRGMMFSYYRGTFLHQAVLPIVDPKSFVVPEES